MLHARALSFDDFSTGERVSFQAPLPDDFKDVIERISWT
jgi:23S rRNA pseudouridine1911/1915/1917 synthase